MSAMVRLLERFINFIHTPAFFDFGYLNGKVEDDLAKGHYKVSVKRDNNRKTTNVKTFVTIRKISPLGGRFFALGVACIMCGITLGLILITLKYIHRVKFNPK